jgi:hypothetical protein
MTLWRRTAAPSCVGPDPRDPKSRSSIGLAPEVRPLEFRPLTPAF